MDKNFIHSTNTGKVIYKRKLHIFGANDVIRIGKRFIFKDFELEKIRKLPNAMERYVYVVTEITYAFLLFYGGEILKEYLSNVYTNQIGFLFEQYTTVYNSITEKKKKEK